MPRTNLKTHYMINALEIIDETTEEARSFHEVKSKVEAALNSGIVPKLTDFGTQGTYFLESIAREPLAVFKPHDEEAFA